MSLTNLFQVSATATSCVHNGWLVLRPPRGTAAKASKRFFLLLPDFVLYSFRGESDSSALTATPVPGFTVMAGQELSDKDASDKDRDKIIKMFHPSTNKVYYFAGASRREVARYRQ